MAMIYTLISLAQEWITVGAQARRAAAWQQTDLHGVTGWQERLAGSKHRGGEWRVLLTVAVAASGPPFLHPFSPQPHTHTTPAFVAAIRCAGQGLRPGSAQHRPRG